MNYRHAFHAGNFADVHKHSVLCCVLSYLRLKPGAFRIIDTHAGAGRYYLLGSEAARSGEWRQGIVTNADAARTFLIKYAQECGARLHANVKIEAPLDPELKINGEARAFDRIIVAGGGWSGKLLPEFERRLTVRRRVLGWFEARQPTGALPVICVDNEVGLFGMPVADGLYKIGMHVVGDRVDPDDVRAPDETDAALLSAQAEAHLPAHDPKPVRMARCLYTMTADENFLIAPSKEIANVLAMSCCSGHGFKYAPAFGHIAEQWLNQQSAPELLAFGRDGRAAAARGLGAHRF